MGNLKSVRLYFEKNVVEEQSQGKKSRAAMGQLKEKLSTLVTVYTKLSTLNRMMNIEIFPQKLGYKASG